MELRAPQSQPSKISVRGHKIYVNGNILQLFHFYSPKHTNPAAFSFLDSVQQTSQGKTQGPSDKLTFSGTSTLNHDTTHWLSVKLKGLNFNIATFTRDANDVSNRQTSYKSKLNQGTINGFITRLSTFFEFKLLFKCFRFNYTKLKKNNLGKPAVQSVVYILHVI